jgi:hypothetical protein
MGNPAASAVLDDTICEGDRDISANQLKQNLKVKNRWRDTRENAGKY